MTRYSREDFDRHQSSSPGPSGMGQAAANWGAQLQQGTSTWGYADRAKDWFSGRNVNDVLNGWESSEFFRASVQTDQDAYKRAMEKNDSREYFNWTKTGTGIQWWDDPSMGDRPGSRSGDIWENGQYKGNLRDMYSDEDADMIMYASMFTGREQKRIGADYRAAVKEKVAEATEMKRNSTLAWEWNKDVGERKEDIYSSFGGSGDEALGIGVGAAGTATVATGAVGLASTLGVITGPIGWGTMAAIAGVTAVVGGVAGWLNRDEIVDTTARSLEKLERTESAGKLGVALETAGSIWMSGASPMKNTVHGATDWKYGAVGDGTAEFYAFDAEGNRKAGGFAQTMDIAASFGDSLLQFGSGTAAKSYMTMMGLVSAGKAAGYMGTGASFNMSTGQYEDLEGAGEWAWAAVDTGIDLLQTGMAKGVSNAAKASRTRAETLDGAAPAKKFEFLRSDAAGAGTLRRLSDQRDSVTGALARWTDETARTVTAPLGGGLREVRARGRAALHPFKDDGAGGFAKRLATARSELSTARAARREMVENAKYIDEVNGMKVYLDENRRVLGFRVTASIIVPSEFAKWVPTMFQKRVMAINNKRGMALDDVYTAAVQMTRGSRWKGTLVNAYAEGTEEFVQGIAEAGTRSETAAWSELGFAFLHGFASGLGMGLGPVASYGKEEMQNLALGFKQYTSATGDQISLDEYKEKYWNRMTQREKEQVVARVAAEDRRSYENVMRMAELATETADGGALWNAAMENAARAAKDSSGTSGTPNLTNAVLMGRPDGTTVDSNGRLVPDGAANDIEVSIETFENMLVHLHRGHREAGAAAANDRNLIEQEIRYLNDIVLPALAAGGLDADQQAAYDQFLRTYDENDLSEQARRDLASISQQQKLKPDQLQAIQMRYEQLLRMEENARMAQYGQAQATMDERIAEQLQLAIDAVRTARQVSPADLENAIDNLNAVVRAAWDGAPINFDGTLMTNEDGSPLDEDHIEAARIAVEVVTSRYPWTSAGSVPTTFVIKVSKEMTRRNLEGVVMIDQGVLKTLGADFDGDRLVQLMNVYYSKARRRELRKGTRLTVLKESDTLAAGGSMSVIVTASDGTERRVLLDSSYAVTAVEPYAGGPSGSGRSLTGFALSNASAAAVAAVPGGTVRSAERRTSGSTTSIDVNIGLPDNEAALIGTLSCTLDPAASAELRAIGDSAMDALGDWLEETFGPWTDDQGVQHQGPLRRRDIDRALANFRTQVRAGNNEARTALIAELFLGDGTGTRKEQLDNSSARLGEPAALAINRFLSVTLSSTQRTTYAVARRRLRMRPPKSPDALTGPGNRMDMFVQDLVTDLAPAITLTDSERDDLRKAITDTIDDAVQRRTAGTPLAPDVFDRNMSNAVYGALRSSSAGAATTAADLRANAMPIVEELFLRYQFPLSEARTGVPSQPMDRASGAPMTVWQTLLGYSDPARMGGAGQYWTLMTSGFHSQTNKKSVDAFLSAAAEFARTYQALKDPAKEQDLDKLEEGDQLMRFVVEGLSNFALEFKRENPGADIDTPQMMMQLASMEVPGFDMHGGRVGPKMTLGQFLLRQGMNNLISRAEIYGPLADDHPLVVKKKRIDRITDNSDPKTSDPSEALLEIFGQFMVSDLLGPSSAHLGPNMTLNQMWALLQNEHEDTRNAWLEYWENSPEYVKDKGVGDPPYFQQFGPHSRGDGSPKISTFAIIVDAIRARSQKIDQQRRAQGRLRGEAFKTAVDNLRGMVGTYKTLYSEEVRAYFDLAPEVVPDDRQVLVWALDHIPSFAQLIAKVIPPAAWSTTFHHDQYGRSTCEEWVIQAFTPDKTTKEKAYKLLYFQPKFDIYRAVGGLIDPPKDGERREIEDVTEDRFVHVIHRAVNRPTKEQGARLLALVNDDSKSIEAVYDELNNDDLNAGLRGDTAKLVPFYDDMADFLSKPDQVFGASAESKTYWDDMAEMAQKLTMQHSAIMDRTKNAEAEKDGLARMLNAAEARATGGTVTDATDRMRLETFEKDFEVRRQVGPVMGAKFYLHESITVMTQVLRTHAKEGGHQPLEAGSGIGVAASMNGEMADAEQQETVAASAYSVADLIANPGVLLQGEVTVQAEDGETFTLNWGTPLGMLRALNDPTTRELARQAYLPRCYEMNQTGEQAVQYINTPHGTNIVEYLDDLADHPVVPPARDSTASPDEQYEQAIRYIGHLEGRLMSRIGHSQDVSEVTGAFAKLRRAHLAFMTAYSMGDYANKAGDVQSVARDQYIAMAQAIYEFSNMGTQTREAEAERLKTYVLTGELPSAELSVNLHKNLMLDITGFLEGVSSVINLDAANERLVLRTALTGVSTVVTMSLEEIRQQMENAADQVDAAVPGTRGYDNAMESFTLAVHMFDAAMNELFSRPGNMMIDESAREHYERYGVLLRRHMAQVESYHAIRQAASLQTIYYDSDERDAANSRFEHIIRYLREGDRLVKFLESKGDERALFEQLLDMDTNDVARIDTSQFTQSQLDAVSKAYAITKYMSNSGVADPSVMPINAVDEAQMDVTWSFLVDLLLDEDVMAVAAEQNIATNPRIGGRPTLDEVQHSVYKSLFKDKVGEWTGMAPVAYSTAINALRGESVKLGISTAGVNPMAEAAKIGSTTIPPKYTVPTDPAFFSSIEVVVQAGESVADAIRRTHGDSAVRKVHRHFAAEVEITYPDGSPLNHETLGLTASAGSTQTHSQSYSRRWTHWVPNWMYGERAQKDQLRLIDLNDLNRGYDVLRTRWNRYYKKNRPAGTNDQEYRIKIVFVDQDKAPVLDNKTEAVNPYFTGIPKSANNEAIQSLQAHFAVWVGQRTSTRQQQAFDFIKKKTVPFLRFIASRQRGYADIRNDYTLTVSERMHRMAEKYISREFNPPDAKGGRSGQLDDDLYMAVLQRIKLTHLIVIRDKDGNPIEYKWPDKAIAYEMQNGGSAMGFEIIPLSTLQSERLHNASDPSSTSGVERRNVNMQDYEIQPDLSLHRVKGVLGMRRLGALRPPGPRAPRLGAIPPMNIAPSVQAGMAKLRRDYDKRIRHYQEVNAPKFEAREAELRARSTRSPREQAAQERADALEAMNGLIGRDALTNRLANQGPPTAALTDPLNIMSHFDSGNILGRLILFSANDDGSKPNIWNDARFGTNAKKLTTADLVVIDVSSIEARLGVPDKYNPQVQNYLERIVRDLAESGVAFKLVNGNSQRGRSYVQNMESWIRSKSGIGYARVDGGIWKPADVGGISMGQMVGSSLMQSRSFGTDGMLLMFVTEEEISTHEGHMLLLEPDRVQWVRDVAPAFPVIQGGYSRNDGSKEQIFFNRPSSVRPRGQTVSQREEVIGWLRDFLDQAGQAHVAALGTIEDKDGNPYSHPQNVAELRTDANGQIEEHSIYGVINQEAAMKRLLATLAKGQLPGDPGTHIAPGDYFVEYGSNGSIMLYRWGFQRPDQAEFDRQTEIAYAPVVVNGQTTQPPAMRSLYVSPPKIEAGHTIAPEMKVEKYVPGGQFGGFLVGEVKVLSDGKTNILGTPVKPDAGTTPESARYTNPTMGTQGRKVTGIMGMAAITGKEAGKEMADTVGKMFKISGYNFEDVLLRYFFGDEVLQGSPDTQRLLEVIEDALRGWADENNIDPTDLAPIDSSASVGELAERLRRTLTSFSIGVDQERLMDGLDRLTQRDWEFKRRANTQADLDRYIVKSMIEALRLRGVTLEHVVKSQGILQAGPGAQVTEMNPYFAGKLSDLNIQGLREHLVARANSVMPRDSTGALINYFDEALFFYMQAHADTREVSGVTADKEYTYVKGRLLPAYLHRAKEHAEANALSESKHSTESPTQGAINTIFEISGGRWSIKNSDKGGKSKLAPKPTSKHFTPDTIERMKNPEDLAPGERNPSYYRLLTDVADRAHISTPESSVPTPFERQHFKKMLSLRNRYNFHIDTTHEKWDDADRSKRLEWIGRISQTMGIEPMDGKTASHIDMLVRQYLGRPGPGKDQDIEAGRIDPDLYMDAAEKIWKNVEAKGNPLENGKVMWPSGQFLRYVYLKNQSRSEGDRWGIVVEHDPKSGQERIADNWYCLVETLLGHIQNSTETFDIQFLADNDAFMQTYDGLVPATAGMPTSQDELLGTLLKDPESARMLMSQDKFFQSMLDNPMVLDNDEMSYDLLVGAYISKVKQSEDAEVSAIAKSQLAQMTWREKRDMRKGSMVMKDFQTEGARFAEYHRNQNELGRFMVNLSLITRLANPGLYVSAMFETPTRSALEAFTDFLLGRGTGRLSQGARKVGDYSSRKIHSALEGQEGRVADMFSIRAKRWVEDARNGGKTDRTPAGFSMAYSHADVQTLRNLAKDLASQPEMIAMLSRETRYRNEVAQGEGGWKANEKLADAAGFVADAFNDPGKGVLMTNAVMRYLTAAIEQMALNGTIMDMNQFAYQMGRDPMWLRKQHGPGWSPHKAGLNRVAQVRASRKTLLGQTIMNTAGMDWLNNSDKSMVNLAGAVWSIPWKFTRFMANATLTFSGLDAFDQMAAMALHGRDKPGFLAKAGKERWDMSDIIETMDLQRSFIKSGNSFTAVLMLGMLASGGGLGGDDDEMRARKRMSEYLGIPVLLDPLKAENAITFADAIFLDSVPLLGNIFQDETGRSAVVPHWILQQFIAPVMGISRFLENGDLREIMWGFEEAFTVIPNSSKRIYAEAKETAELIATGEGAIPDPNDPGADMSASARTMKTAIMIVSVWERALFENATVNALLNDQDTYDRDPYAIPLTMENGDLHVTQGEGLPQQSDAVRLYKKDGTEYIPAEGEELMYQVDEKGVISGAYIKEYGSEASKKAFAETNAVFRMVAAAFTGFGDSQYLRKNMVVKQQHVDRGLSDKGTMEALIFAAQQGMGGQEVLTLEERINIIKQRYRDQDLWYEEADVEAEAVAWARIDGGLMSDGTNILSDEAKAALQNDRTRAVFEGLRAGTITLDNPAIRGFAADQAIRDQIAEEWMVKLKEEGLALGLSETQANYRARRFWYGDDNNPEVKGLKWIIYDNRIPDSGKVSYNQLNVTYVMGPDGKPWATPFNKNSLLAALGIPIPRTIPDAPPGTSLDERGNVIDDVLGINTGLSGVVPVPHVSSIEPKDDAVAAAEKTTGTPTSRYRRGGGGGYGGGGGGYVREMRPLPSGTGARLEDLPYINVLNPSIRRARTNRQRITSERGRLKQWQ